MTPIRFHSAVVARSVTEDRVVIVLMDGVPQGVVAMLECSETTAQELRKALVPNGNER
jgi:hypothetical protein